MRNVIYPLHYENMKLDYAFNFNENTNFLPVFR